MPKLTSHGLTRSGIVPQQILCVAYGSESLHVASLRANTEKPESVSSCLCRYVQEHSSLLDPFFLSGPKNFLPKDTQWSNPKSRDGGYLLSRCYRGMLHCNILQLLRAWTSLSSPTPWWGPIATSYVGDWHP